VTDCDADADDSRVGGREAGDGGDCWVSGALRKHVGLRMNRG